MPASKHTRKVKGNPKAARQWAHVRASAEARGASPGQAIRMASGVIKKQHLKKARKPKRNVKR